ncbi:MAG: hypothetical protein EOO77_32220, partial [Oxalobacteraceae bacterium]
MRSVAPAAFPSEQTQTLGELFHFFKELDPKACSHDQQGYHLQLNVQPSLYDGPAHPDGTPEDAPRDAMTMRLIRAAIAAGLPIFAICRGLQELNVALGGSLHQRLQDLPGRMDHSTPMHPNPRLRTGKAHAVRLVPGSWIHRVAGAATIPVNSLHNQGIDRLAPGLVAEGTDDRQQVVHLFPRKVGGVRLADVHEPGAVDVGHQVHQLALVAVVAPECVKRDQLPCLGVELAPVPGELLGDVA